MAPSPAYDKPRLLDLFSALNLAAKTYDHPPVFRVEEGLDLKVTIPGPHTKNLFLKDKKGNIVLISARQDTQIPLKTLHLALGTDRFSFGSEALLFETLGVRPGSVTAYALVNDTKRRVRFILDARLAKAELLNFHPLSNDATTALSQQDFQAFLTHLGICPEVIDFATLIAD